MTRYHCTTCQTPYPDEIAFKCPNCGGVFDVSDEGISYDPAKIEKDLPNLWSYRHSFGLPENTPIITLGEGNTPLVPAGIFGKQVHFKLEYLNPTGSFKDRITAPEISYLKAKGVAFAVEDSSGNAGASFSAYAARAGIKGRVYVPSYASGPKRAQIEAYGSEVVPVPGPRSKAAEAVLQAVEEEGAVYASHGYLPVGHPGLATIAYELVEQLGETPGTVIAPVGHGSLLLGIAQGFQALHRAGQIKRLPALVGVQSQACAPLWLRANHGPEGLYKLEEGETLAEGVRIKNPIRGDALIALANEMDIEFAVVSEEQIKVGHKELARLGFFVEYTSAIVWNALEQLAEKKPDPIIIVLTGSGLKSIG